MQLTSKAIAEYALSVSQSDLSSDAVESVRQLLFDSIGCCLGAYASPPSKHLRSTYGGMADGNATVFGSGTKTRVEYAALINATMVRYLDYNDTYISEGRACHPSDHIPALISVAEAEDATGEELVEAIAVAYEIQGLALDTGVMWDNDYDYVSWGAYSTAAAAGKLMDLSNEELVNALGIAGSSNLALSISRKGDVSMWKGVAHPFASHNAIQACQMASAGLTGPNAVFEGPGGLFEVAAGRELTIDALGGHKGERFRVTRSHMKPFPCGYYMQPMITGVRDLMDEHVIDPDGIETIDIETFSEAATILGGEEKWSTQLTRESADHSIPYTTALAIIYGDVSPYHYDEEYRTDPKLHNLMDRVRVRESESMNTAAAKQPDSTPSVIRMTVNGTTYETRVDYAPGHAKNPFSTEVLEDKVRELVTPLLTEREFGVVQDFCSTVDEQDSVRPLLRAIKV